METKDTEFIFKPQFKAFIFGLVVLLVLLALFAVLSFSTEENGLWLVLGGIMGLLLVFVLITSIPRMINPQKVVISQAGISIPSKLPGLKPRYFEFIEASRPTVTETMGKKILEFNQGGKKATIPYSYLSSKEEFEELLALVQSKYSGKIYVYNGLDM